MHATSECRVLAVLVLFVLAVAPSASSWKLLAAAFNGKTADVRKALRKGADVNAKDEYQQTALILASSNGHADVAKLLLSKGADVNAKTGDGKTALLWASFKGHEAVVRVLLTGVTCVVELGVKLPACSAHGG